MSLILNQQINRQISEISKLTELTVDYTALIGYLDSKNNKINILSCIHLPKKLSTSENGFLDEQDINHLSSYNNLLPYPLSIIGIIFYRDEEITTFSLKKIFDIVEDNLKILTIGNKTENNLSFYTLTKNKFVKLKYEKKDIPIQKIIQLIHTIEFECSEDILINELEMKEKVFNEMNKLWDLVTYSKKEDITVKKIIQERRSLDRIIEAVIPCKEKNLSSKTEKGKAFFAYDLHMNIYPVEEILDLKLSDLNEFFNKALGKDLLVKLQRSEYDKKNRKLIAPNKIPIKFFDIELNAYFSKDKPSKFEFKIMKQLIFHTQIMNKVGFELQSRIALRDIYNYFSNFEDKEILEKITYLITEMTEKSRN